MSVPARRYQPAVAIGGYQVQAPLGAGGMGVVYRALDTKLNRPVAIKLLSDDLADAAARRRFQREAQTASSLNHPHIVTVHDVGRSMAVSIWSPSSSTAARSRTGLGPPSARGDRLSSS